MHKAHSLESAFLLVRTRQASGGYAQAVRSGVDK